MQTVVIASKQVCSLLVLISVSIENYVSSYFGNNNTWVISILPVKIQLFIYGTNLARDLVRADFF